jgi:TM2 domain-containing membrane protein YozV
MKGVIGIILLPFVAVCWLVIFIHSLGLDTYDLLFGWEDDE